MRAFALTDNVPLLSAWANDCDYASVFAEQLEGFIEEDDVAIGISGSGNSQNVLDGIRLAREKGATTIGFIGFGGGRLKDIVDLCVIVGSHDMRQVEDLHLLLTHALTTCLAEG
jgi:D-sedoheptulose 7-phosphate isomerase